MCKRSKLYNEIFVVFPYASIISAFRLNGLDRRCVQGGGGSTVAIFAHSQEGEGRCTMNTGYKYCKYTCYTLFCFGFVNVTRARGATGDVNILAIIKRIWHNADVKIVHRF